MNHELTGIGSFDNCCLCESQKGEWSKTENFDKELPMRNMGDLNALYNKLQKDGIIDQRLGFDVMKHERFNISTLDRSGTFQLHNHAQMDETNGMACKNFCPCKSRETKKTY